MSFIFTKLTSNSSYHLSPSDFVVETKRILFQLRIAENMIFVLLFFLIALTDLFFLSFGRSFTSPSVIVSGVFVVSTIVAILNINVWKYTFSAFGVIVIVTGLLAFAAGEMAVWLLYPNPIAKAQKNYGRINISRKIIAIIFFIECIITFLYFYEQKRLAERMGFNGTGLMLMYARKASISAHEEISRPVAWALRFVHYVSENIVFHLILCIVAAVAVYGLMLVLLRERLALQLVRKCCGRTSV